MTRFTATAHAVSHRADIDSWSWSISITDAQGAPEQVFEILALDGDAVFLPRLRDLLHARGYRMDGYWKPTPGGYCAALIRDCDYQPPSWAGPRQQAQIVAAEGERYSGIPVSYRTQLYSEDWQSDSEDAGSTFCVELSQVDRFKDGEILRGLPRIGVRADSYGLSGEQVRQLVQALRSVQEFLPERKAA
ncbi:hypothetical protein ACX80O_03350 [Arthrobacter sp. Hz1]